MNRSSNNKSRRKGRGPLSPRPVRMSRHGRLQSAQSWLRKYTGNNITAAYHKHFGVDWVCAFKELEMLGIKLDPKYVDQVLKSVECQIVARQSRETQQKENRILGNDVFDQDENFAFIAGYTAGGVPFGLTWEEFDESPNPSA